MKRFAIKFLAFFAMGYILVLCYQFVFRPMMIGDIGRLGKVMFGTEKYEFGDIRPTNAVIDIVIGGDTILSSDKIYTIGDSFSYLHGGIYYRYSQYIGDSIEVYNIQTSLSPMQEMVNLINKGQIPHNTYVIVESVERQLIARLVDLKFSDTASVVKDTNMSSQPKNEKKRYFTLPKVNEISAWMRMNLFNMDNPIEHFKLSQECFLYKGYENDLYVYNHDFNYQEVTSQQYKQAVDNLKQFKSIADSAGVNMIFLVAADKYDVYSLHIIDNSYPHNPTMDYFVNIDTTWFVDTKRLLQPLIDVGVKDVYYVNDTHWSPIGAKIVGEYLAALIQ